LTTARTPAKELPSDFFVDVDHSSPMPLYFQVATHIASAIESGILPPGARLENEIDLGERLSLSRPTIRRAIQELVDKGLLVRRRGIGTHVVQRPMTRTVELTSLYDDLERGMKHPRTDLLLHEVIGANEDIAVKLSVPVGTEVLHIRRLRFADSGPLAVLENFLAPEFSQITEEELITHGLYQQMRSRGAVMSVAQQHIGARASNSDESHLLGITSHGPVLTMERTVYNNAGRAVEFGHHCYRPDLYSFEITLVSS
jgi:DNA-binding GntR family transcriptional regulator